MYVNFNDLPDTARVWVYQSNRMFSEKEQKIIQKKAVDFISKWTKHGKDLQGSFVIKHNHFIILAVNESFNGVSGCSIDASVHFIKQLENELQIDLTNKLNVSFKDADTINIVSLSDFKKYIKENKVSSKTLVFNNLIKNKKDVAINWEVTASKSWHQSLFTATK